jgi:hypothetical protein
MITNEEYAAWVKKVGKDAAQEIQRQLDEAAEFDVFDSDSHEFLGSGTRELATKSETGVVYAVKDDSGVWCYVPSSKKKALRILGKDVRRVCVLCVR